MLKAILNDLMEAAWELIGGKRLYISIFYVVFVKEHYIINGESVRGEIRRTEVTASVLVKNSSVRIVINSIDIN